jgi:hypothetical protein
VLGFFATAGAAYPILSRQCALLASVLVSQEKKNGGVRAFEELRAKPHSLTGGMRYIKSPRHAFYVQFDAYMHELERVRQRVEYAAR